MRVRFVRTLLIVGVTAGLLGLGTPGSAMIEPGFPGGDAGAVQTGVVAVSQPNPTTWFSVTFDEPYESAPVVVMGPVSEHGGRPAFMRVRNVTTTGFEYQLDEWDYQDGNHVPATASWLAIGEGWHDFVGMTAYATTVELDHTWSTVELGFGETPVVFAQIASENDAAAATIRMRKGSGSSIQLKLEEEEAADDVHGVETVHVIAMNEGSTTMDGVGLLVGRTGNAVEENWYSVSATSHGVTGVLASTQSYRGGDSINLRYRNLSDAGFDVFVQEEESANSELNHVLEDVGWMMITSW